MNAKSDEKSEAEKQSDAALKLGLLEYENKSLEAAVKYMENHFDAVTKLTNKKNINLSRVNLGIAKAEQTLSKTLNRNF